MKNENSRMSKIVQEFKDFINNGNVFHLAIGIIIGAAFGKIVSSLVDDILMPIVGVFMGGLDFSELTLTIGEAKIAYGNFIQNVVDFLIIAVCIFFFVKMISKLQKKDAEPEEPAPEEKDEQLEVLKSINETLKEIRKS